MVGKSKTDEAEIDFKKLYESLSDGEISEILMKRSQYQKDAADAAVNEAIKRGIIHSEQDLFAEKYRGEPLKFSLFPMIENETSRKKTIKSLTRSLLFLGTIMMAWGVWEIIRHNLTEGIGFIFAGVVWNIISFSFFKIIKPVKVNALFVIQALEAVYAAFKLVNYKSLIFMDVFVVIVLFGFVLYGLIYLKKLSV
jgi:hypothetical protein